MTFLRRLLNFHVHYWGRPRVRESDNRLVQTCYYCSKDRKLKVELRPPDMISLR